MITEAMIRAGVLATYRPGVCTEEDDVRAIFTAMIGAVDEEVVARAISGHCFVLINGHDDCGDWNEMSADAQGVYRQSARAALSAIAHIKEPSQ